MQHRSCRALFRRTQNLHANLARRTNQQEISFASWLINEKGYKTLLREHCALARLIAQGIEFWVRDTRQLIQRFNEDKKELAILCDSQTIKTITRIRMVYQILMMANNLLNELSSIMGLVWFTNQETARHYKSCLRQFRYSTKNTQT